MVLCKGKLGLDLSSLSSTSSKTEVRRTIVLTCLLLLFPSAGSKEYCDQWYWKPLKVQKGVHQMHYPQSNLPKVIHKHNHYYLNTMTQPETWLEWVNTICFFQFGFQLFVTSQEDLSDESKYEFNTWVAELNASRTWSILFREQNKTEPQLIPYDLHSQNSAPSKSKQLYPKDSWNNPHSNSHYLKKRPSHPKNGYLTALHKCIN